MGRQGQQVRVAATLAAGSLLALLSVSPSRAQNTPQPPVDDIPLSATFVTEGTLPATEIEGGFSFTKSETDRTYQFGFSSLQYAWGTIFGLKLSVPFTVLEPRGDDGSTVAGLGDVSVLAKSAPLVSAQHHFALGGGVAVTLPTGSKSRGLGGVLAVTPMLLAGKGWRLGERIAVVQADARYSWQLNDPVPGDADREQRFSANVTAALTLLPWLTGILEANSARVVAGDPALRDRWQLYVTPGLSVQPAERWDIRAGIQVPLTGTREFDYSVLFLVTKGF